MKPTNSKLKKMKKSKEYILKGKYIHEKHIKRKSVKKSFYPPNKKSKLDFFVY